MDVTGAALLLLFGTATVLVVGDKLPQYRELETLAAASDAVNEALTVASCGLRSSVVLLTDGTTSSRTIRKMGHVEPCRGLTVLEVPVAGQDANTTKTRLSLMIDKAQQVSRSHITGDVDRSLAHYC
nr:uncharacterized protein LOC123759256 [Procambarus clarkii]